MQISFFAYQLLKTRIMNSKDFSLKVSIWTQFHGAFDLFTRQKNPPVVIFRCRTRNLDGHSYTLYSEYTDVDITLTSDEFVDFIIIDRYTISEFLSDMKRFASFYYKCTKWQKDVLNNSSIFHAYISFMLTHSPESL